jgi:hypothetical protein
VKGIDAASRGGADHRTDIGEQIGPPDRAEPAGDLSVGSHHPFILPMSDKSWKSNTVGIPISGAKSWFVG